MAIKLPPFVTINYDGKTKTVNTQDYLAAKTKQLQEFGYPSLTREEVKAELGKIFNGGKLTVIGMFMEGEIQK